MNIEINLNQSELPQNIIFKKVLFHFNRQKKAMRANSRYDPNEESLFVAALAKAMGMPNNKVYAKNVLEAFFKTIRVRIPTIASSTLIAHLPIEIKGMYRLGWNKKSTQKFDYDEFITALSQQRNAHYFTIFLTQKDAKKTVTVIFKFIKTHLTDDQYALMMSFMPLLLRINLSPDYLFEGQSYCI